MAEELTPMMRQYREMKARYPEAILFFQLGDFYETFFDDAELVSRELEITLTSRDGVPMAGVPVRRAEFYIQKLLKRGYKVALCPQLEPPGKGKKLLRRAVVRVLTPGTVIEEGALEAERDVLLAALWPEGERLGVAWAEAASGQIWAEELAAAELENLAARIPVAEWLVPEGFVLPLKPEGAVTPRPAPYFQAEALFSRFPGALRGAPLAARAAGALLRYLQETLGELPHLRPPLLRREEETMVLDPFTQRALELLEPLRPEGKLTVLSVLDRTKTPMGKRLLRRWLLAPLRERKSIEARLDTVQILIETGFGRSSGVLWPGAMTSPASSRPSASETLAPSNSSPWRGPWKPPRRSPASWINSPILFRNRFPASRKPFPSPPQSCPSAFALPSWNPLRHPSRRAASSGTGSTKGSMA
jgi:DNA mismatch repair protein MutS